MSLRTIYTAVSEMRVGEVKARNLDQLKQIVRQDDCPMRLLLPSTEGDFNFFGVGTLTRVTWSIRDLCLWQPLKAGTGIEQCANEMLAYIELYAAAVRTLRTPTNNSTIVGVSYKIQPVLWAETDFWAVDVNLDVEEYEA